MISTFDLFWLIGCGPRFTGSTSFPFQKALRVRMKRYLDMGGVLFVPHVSLEGVELLNRWGEANGYCTPARARRGGVSFLFGNCLEDKQLVRSTPSY